MTVQELIDKLIAIVPDAEYRTEVPIQIIAAKGIGKDQAIVKIDHDVDVVYLHGGK